MKKALIYLSVALSMVALVFAAETGCTTCAENANSETLVSAAAHEVASSQGGFSIEKKAISRITIGETVIVEITLKNDYAANLSVEIKEYIGGAEAVDLGGFVRSTPKGSPIPPYYKKTVMMGPNSQTTVTYSMKPLYHGTLIIPETEASTVNGKYSSNLLVLEVECNKNKRCEVDQAENAITCPQDCPLNRSDKLCHPRKDSACDPDCEGGVDPDCGATMSTTSYKATTTSLAGLCGNKACDMPEENYGTCPADCASGSADGYCDREDDGKCDPECSPGEDPDCQASDGPSLLIAALFVIGLIAVFAYKKGWLQKRD